MKKYCVIFDTNILIENKIKLSEIKTKIKEISDIYIPRIVIDEVQAQKSRNITEDYLKIQGIIDKNKESFMYEEKFKLSDVISNSDESIEKWLRSYCNSNILEYKKIDLNDILSRLKYKKAPFINEVGSSDKGFKDTIIWLSIIKNEVLQDYDKIILVTNDKTGFVKRKDELYKEYEEQCTSSFIICSSTDEMYKELNIVNTDNLEETTNNTEDTTIENIEDIKNSLNNCVEHIIYIIYEDNWGNDRRNNRFCIYDKMNNEDVECFLSNLGDFLKENIFFDDMDICEILSACGVESVGEYVPAKYLEQLNEIYNKVKDKKDLYEPFIKFLKAKFNDVYTIKQKSFDSSLANIDPDDLPF